MLLALIFSKAYAQQDAPYKIAVTPWVETLFYIYLKCVRRVFELIKSFRFVE